MSTQAINFKQSCVKTLSAVEASPESSNQHEFNGVSPLKEIFGKDKITDMDVLFSIRGDEKVYASKMTWYDAREAHLTRSEYRLYFKNNDVMDAAKEGDNIIIGIDSSGNYHCELIPQNSLNFNAVGNQWIAET